MIGRFAIVAFALLLGIAAALSQPIPPDRVDEKPPIPPENSKQNKDAARFRIDKELGIYTGTRDPKTGVVKGGIEDDRPLASEKQNADEYQALTSVMLHAAQFTAADLAEAGRRDLSPDDLTYSARFQFRLDLVRFEGKLVKARRLQPTKSLEESGFKELIEAWLVPEEESPGYPLALLLSSWPDGFVPLPPIPAGQQAGESVAIDKWVLFGGYSFKLMTYPGPGADPAKPTSAGWLKAPLLIGKSVVPAPEPPARIPLDKNLRVFSEIRDDTTLSQSPEHWEQLSAWNRAFMHARRFSAEELEAAADRRVPFAELLENHRDHKLDLIHIQGQLIRLIEGKSTQRLAEAGITTWYEGWIIPTGEPSGHPLSIAILDLPPGLEPRKSMDVPVSFAGYAFKRRIYESGEKKKDYPEQNVWKKAPFLIGRSVTIRKPDVDTTAFWTEGFVPAVVGGVVLLGGLAVTLGWWFRKGDRAAQAEIEANRHRNPF